MKILWLLLTLFMSSPAMQKKRVKRKCEVIQDMTIKKCPYCDTQQKDLSNHMLDEHKIDRVVLSEWLVDITSLHAIKNSRYDIAGIPCICNRFFRSNKSILRHQKSKDRCPARSSSHAYRYVTDATLPATIAKVEPPSTPLTRPLTLSLANKKTKYLGDESLDELLS